MEDEKLHQELQARIFIHKFSILGAYLQKKYIANELIQNPLINSEELMEKAEDFAGLTIRQYMEDGSIDDMYETAYAIVASSMPEDLNTLANIQ